MAREKPSDEAVGAEHNTAGDLGGDGEGPGDTRNTPQGRIRLGRLEDFPEDFPLETF